MKIKYKILIITVVLLTGIRLILPYVVLYYANKTLAEMDGYYGHIKDIELSVYRGAYILDNIYINKFDLISKKQTEFFKARDIDLSIEWGALFHGSIAGELVFDSPELIFTKDKVELDDVGKDGDDFRKLLKHFMPLKINSFEVKDGAIYYKDNTSKPKVDISLKKTHILAINLTNIVNKKVELPSTVNAQASVYGGNLNFTMKINALADDPTFDLNAEIKNANLVLFNDFLKAYGGFDVNKGNFSLYTEMAAKSGKFAGYVKPIITDLDVVGPEDKKDNIFNKIWEALVGAAGVIFKNQKENQLATKIRIEGSFINPKTSTFDTIWGVLGNAFIKALVPSIDKDINLNSVKTAKPENKTNSIQNNKPPEKKNDK